MTTFPASSCPALSIGYIKKSSRLPNAAISATAIQQKAEFLVMCKDTLMEPKD
jgi:hypothetical protein